MIIEDQNFGALQNPPINYCIHQEDRASDLQQQQRLSNIPLR